MTARYAVLYRCCGCRRGLHLMPGDQKCAVCGSNQWSLFRLKAEAEDSEWLARAAADEAAFVTPDLRAHGQPYISRSDTNGDVMNALTASEDEDAAALGLRAVATFLIEKLVADVPGTNITHETLRAEWASMCTGAWREAVEQELRRREAGGR